MAASTHTNSNRTSSLHVGSSAGGALSLPLPTGSCNFRELSGGATAPTCGCTRFWQNAGSSQMPATSFERAWCFCGHHACFHNVSSQQTTISDLPTAAQVQSMELDRPRTGDRTSQERHAQEPLPSKPEGLGIHTELPKPVTQPSVNIQLWEALNTFARNQEIGLNNAMSLPSTAVPSIAGERSRSPMSVLGMQYQQPRAMAPPLDIPKVEPAMTVTDEYSATEVATPSAIGTPDMRNAHLGLAGFQQESPSNIAPSTFLPNVPWTSPLPPPPPHLLQRPLHSANHGPPPVIPPRATMSLQDIRKWRSMPVGPSQNLALHELRHLVSSLGQRLENLENISFSHVPIEAVQDKFEFMEGRLLDLEHWRSDCEDVQKQKEILPHHHDSASENEPSSSFSSDASFDSHAAAYTEAAILATLAANSETAPYLAALEGRITELESVAMPSFSRPWQVEVVYLPWGRELRGIWFSSTESTQHSLGMGEQTMDEWAPTSSGPRISFKSASSAAWTTESIQAWADETQEWLSPKACGPSGVVFQRLLSCGFVQTVTLTAANSDHICTAIGEAFAPILDRTNDVNRSFDERLAGLSERFVPLRKVRKSSRLRFLKRAEMITSALWTAEFLDSGVCMKLDPECRRLYVTSPEAYTQPQDGGGWTWPKLRQLSLLQATGTEREVQESRVAIEACWSYHDRLDRSMRPLSESSESLPESRSSQLSNRSPVEFSMQRSSFGDLKSTSAPPPAAIMTKRRVVSADSGVALTPSTGPLVEASTAKRQRLSTSPEVERKGAGLTPRWSREPPSPFTSENAADSRSQLASQRQRSNTPFAYATPHSHSARYNGRPDSNFRASDFGTDAEAPLRRSWTGDEEWQGVDELLRHDDKGREDESSDYEEADDDDSDEDDDDNDDEEAEGSCGSDDDNDSVVDSVRNGALGF